MCGRVALSEGMSREKPPRALENTELLVQPVPLLVTLGLDRPALDPNGFMFVNRDDATGVPKLTSGAVAEWATMVLSETLGL